MTERTRTTEQNAALAKADAVLSSVNLPTYTEIVEALDEVLHTSNSGHPAINPQGSAARARAEWLIGRACGMRGQVIRERFIDRMFANLPEADK